MNKKLAPYLLFGSGVYTGAMAATFFYAKMTMQIQKRMQKIETISKLVLDLDKWMWETIEQPEDTEDWTEELKNKLDYIEMVVALYYLED